MKQFYILTGSLLLSLSAFAQYYPPSIQWQKAIGTFNIDQFNAVIPTADGGYIAAGETHGNDLDISDNHGGVDALIVKYDAAGIKQWHKCYGGSGGDYAYDIKQTIDGGYIIVGQTSSSDGDVTVNKGFSDGWIFKINSLGIIEWQKTYGSSGGDGFRGIDVDADGRFVVIGSCGANDGDVLGSGFKGGGDVWLLKLNGASVIEWQKTYGSTKADGGNDIEITADGGYVIAGITNGNDDDVSGFHAGSYNPARLDMWVIKTDSIGFLQWQKCLGGGNSLPTNFPDDEAFAVQQANDGGYVVAGYTSSIDGDVTNYHGGIRDGWVVKLSSTGNIQWQRTFGGSSDDYIRNIIKHPDGGFVLCGYTASGDGDLAGQPLRANIDGWLIKIDSLGNIQWQRMLRTSGIDRAISISMTPGGGFIVGGYASFNDLDAAGNPWWGTNPNAWIVKLSPQVLPVSLLDFTVKKTSQGNVLKWQTANEVNFSHFVVERSNDGNIFSAIATVPSNNVGAPTKTYSYTDRDLPPVPKLYYRLKLVDKDGSYAYSAIIATVHDQQELSISPNPASSLLTIRSEVAIKQVTVVDAAGRIYLVEKGTNIDTLNILALPAGTYYLQTIDMENAIRLLPFIKK